MNKRAIWTFIAAVSIVSISIYWSTSYRTITWWDNSSYPIAANCLGVESPPGSLILTILGWIVIKLSILQSEIFSLNIFAGILAASTIALLFRQIVFLAEKTTSIKYNKYYLLSGISFGLLTFAFSETFWTYSTQFTPYILTACMTAFILYQLLKFWFEEDAHKIICLVFFISFLFGLDFSIHRTNAVMVPGFIAIIFLKDLKLFKKLKFWLSGAAGLLAGLSFHLLKIAIASTEPIVNFNNPNNLSRFYDYVSLKQYGGGFLTDVFTRKAPVFTVQTYDYLKTLFDNFIFLDTPLEMMSIFTVFLAMVGVYSLFKSKRKTALMLVMLYLLTTAMTIFYFNIPENFFRSLSRHYLPSFVIFSIFIGYGAGLVFSFIKQNTLFLKIVKIALVIILFLMPFQQVMRNYSAQDGSKDTFAYDYAGNILESLRPDAVLFVVGDVYYPIFYLQQVEGKRKDVDIVSLSLTNTTWYVKQLMSDHYHLPLTLTDDEISSIGPMTWNDTTIDIQFDGNIAAYQIQPTNSITSVSMRVQPTLAETYIMGQDWFVLEMLKENKWKKPIYFTLPPSWLNDYSRPEGLVWQLMPQSKPDINAELLQNNLMKNYKYNGYKNYNRPIEFQSKRIGEDLWNQFMQLALYQNQTGDTTSVKATIDYVKENIPLERVVRSEESLERFKQILTYFDNK